MCQADPSWVDLVLIAGDITYVRHDWYTDLVGRTIPAGTTVEKLTAWGKLMDLNTGFQSPTDESLPLSGPRDALITAYPPVGPIFA